MAELGIQNTCNELALEVIKVSRFLRKNRREFDLARQLLRSGTAVGAMVSEAKFAESDKDFIHKLSIGLKEANECRYWVQLLKLSGLIQDHDYKTIVSLLTKTIGQLVKSKKSMEAKTR